MSLRKYFCPRFRDKQYRRITLNRWRCLTYGIVSRKFGVWVKPMDAVICWLNKPHKVRLYLKHRFLCALFYPGFYSPVTLIVLHVSYLTLTTALLKVRE